MSAPTPEQVADHGLTPQEYERVVEVLGRPPTLPELGVFSVMWSEHCSYKSSRIHLRKLPTTGPRVIVGPGENAGAVDIGEGLAVVFKMESHNHPSFIEPAQGAATGVGGILRDVFTMGARPVALLDSLRFGTFDHPRTRHLVDGVVGGIAWYGNCMGIPTVGGELRFHPAYGDNCLVNAFACGVVRRDRIFLGRAAGPGNPVIYVGARTGRDGIHGATMASEAFEEDSEARRPTVQVGDPFQEKLLLEACLELMATDCIVGIQDMGAAGLTSSSVEMAGRGGAGLVLDLDRVPVREEGMSPYEILLSESQERMLLVAAEGREEEVARVFAKWDLEAVVIGRVTDDGVWRCRWRGEEVCAIPVAALTDDAPTYDRPWVEPVAPGSPPPADPELPDPGAALLELVGHVEACDRSWVYRQYDHQVGTDTEVLPGHDAALLRIKGTDLHLAFATDCNARHVVLDPFQGTAGQVAECARNLACVGAEPVGLTDCLNFGDPEQPEIMGQFVRAVEGMAEACRALGVPVVSGNVSLYNATRGRAILPTPAVAMVGLLRGDPPRARSRFAAGGLGVALLGSPGAGHLGGSLAAWVLLGAEGGAPPPVDLEAERRLHRVVRGLVREGLVRTAHDLSDGGLAVALAEACLDGVGADVRLPPGGGGLFGRLFGEDHGRVLVAFDLADLDAVAERAAPVGFTALGRTGGDALRILDTGPEPLLELPVARIRERWRATLPELMA